MAVEPTRLIVENLLALVRVSNGVTAEVRAMLRELFDEIVAEMARMDPTATASEVLRRRKVERLIEEVEAMAGDSAAGALETVRQRIAEIGAQQARFAARLLERSVGPIEVNIEPGTIGVRLAKTILDHDPINGDLLAESFADLGANVAKGFRREIRIGMTRGETLGDLVKRIRGRSDGEGGFVGGVMDTTTRGAESLVRTAVNDISNRALMDTWQENDDVVDGYEVIATLDSRTCFICGPKDRQQFKLEDESGRPPFHRGCRCATKPVIAWKKLGVSPPKAGTRASADGPVSAKVDYDGWLRSQDASTQDEILGPSRARLFRAGKVGLADLIRTDGRIISLADLS